MALGTAMAPCIEGWADKTSEKAYFGWSAKVS